MSYRMIRETSRLTCLFALAATMAPAANGQVPAAASQLVIRSGLHTPAPNFRISPPDIRTPILKSEDTALWLSLGSTLLPMGAGALMLAASDEDGTLGTVGALLTGSGLYFGPAVGYWYGGAAGRGWKGVGIRFGTGLVASLGVLAICGGNGGENCNFFDSKNDDTVAAASLLMLAGLGVMAFSAVYDIAKVKSHVREANDEKRRHAAQIAVAPVVSPANGGTAGLVASIRF